MSFGLYAQVLRKGILGHNVSWPKGKQTGTETHSQHGPWLLLPLWNVGICQIVLVMCFVLLIPYSNLNMPGYQ